MDRSPSPTLEDRVERLETEVAALRGSIAELRSRTAALPAQTPVRTAATAGVPARLPQTNGRINETYCAFCHGGNPPDGKICMWCGHSLALRPALPPQPVPEAATHVRRVPTAPVQATSTEQIEALVAPAVPQPSRPEPVPPTPPPPRRAERAIEPVAARLAPPPVEAARVGITGETPRPAVGLAPTTIKVPSAPLKPRKPFNATVWLSRTGIVLFLLGVAFLFKYSLDQGWIDAFLSYPVRVGIGLTLGTILLVTGLRLGREHRYLSQVLMGGSIATYYITGFAASRVFDVVSADASCVFMLSVTALAFVLASNQNGTSLGIIGVAGGLATPFVLYNLDVSLPWLVAYTCFILAGSSAVYIFKGWRTLLWVSVAGGWGALLLGYLENLFLVGSAIPAGDQIALQLGIVGCLLAFWAVPVLREVMHSTDPLRWRHIEAPRWVTGPNGVLSGATPADMAVFNAGALTLIAPFVTLGFSVAIWPRLAQENWGLVAMGGAVLFAFTAWALTRFEKRLAYAHAVEAVLLLTTGLLLLLNGNLLLLALAVEGTALHFVARRYSDRIALAGGHLLFAAAGTWLLYRLVEYHLFYGTWTVLNADALTDLAVICLAALSSTWLKSRQERLLYSGAAYLAVLPWLLRESQLLSGSQNYLLVALAAYGLGMHYLGSRREDKAATMAGHASYVCALVLFPVNLVWAGEPATEFANWTAAAGLAAIALAWVAQLVVRPDRVAQVYRTLVFLAVLPWLARELVWLHDGTSYLMLAWAAYGFAMHYLADRLSDRAATIAGHASFALSGILLGLTLGLAHISTPFANVTSLLAAGVVVLAWAASLTIEKRVAAPIYRFAAYMAVLCWLGSNLWFLENGYSYVTLALAAAGAGLHYYAHRSEEPAASLAGHMGFTVAGVMVALLLMSNWTGSDFFGSQSTPFANMPAVAGLAVLALAMSVSFIVQPKELAISYRLPAHALVLAWLATELRTYDWSFDYILFASMAYAAVLLLVDRRFSNLETHLTARVIVTAVGALALARTAYWLWMTNPYQTPIFNLRGLADLGVLAFGALCVWLMRGEKYALAYWLGLHIAFGGWLWQELGMIPPATVGNAYASLAWGLYAVVLIAVGLNMDRNRRLIYTGIATLFAVAAKLLLVDLRYVDAIWRILLFLGFGSLFLVTSYYLEKWLSPGGPTRPHAHRPART